jgi:hypothetical protein
MNPTLQIIVTLVPIVGGFLFWHFKTVNAFKDDIYKLSLKMKDLEHRDDLQQQTMDQLNKLYPLFEEIFKNLNKDKK